MLRWKQWMGGLSLGVACVVMPGLSAAQTTTTAAPAQTYTGAEVDAAFFRGVCLGSINSAEATLIGYRSLRAFLGLPDDPPTSAPAVASTTPAPAVATTTPTVSVVQGKTAETDSAKAAQVTAATVQSMGTGRQRHDPPPVVVPPINTFDLVSGVVFEARKFLVLPQPTDLGGLVIVDDDHDVYIVCKADGTVQTFPVTAPVPTPQ